jgi:hypothetical protein
MRALPHRQASRPVVCLPSQCSCSIFRRKPHAWRVGYVESRARALVTTQSVRWVDTSTRTRRSWWSLGKPLTSIVLPCNRSSGLQSGDKVLQRVVNDDKAVFDGDIGRIAATDPEQITLTVTFASRAVRVTSTAWRSVRRSLPPASTRPGARRIRRWSSRWPCRTTGCLSVIRSHGRHLGSAACGDHRPVQALYKGRVRPVPPFGSSDRTDRSAKPTGRASAMR